MTKTVTRQDKLSGYNRGSLPTMEEPVANDRFRRLGGRPCLDFVNTVSGWASPAGPPGHFRELEERMPDYQALLDWSAPVLDANVRARLERQAQEDPRSAERVLVRAHALRAALYRIFHASLTGVPPERADLDRLEREWREARSHERLVPAGHNLAIALDGDTPPLDRLLHEVARSAVELLTSPDLGRVHRCPGEGCGWLFLDTSRAGRRRWCDMRDCGNVSKVRRFRERQARGTS